MDQSLSSEQFKASRRTFFQKKLTSFYGTNISNISNISDIDKVVCRAYSVKKGDYLYREGEVCSALYVVRSGSVKTTKQSATGQVQVVGFHLVGELIGFDGFATGYHDCTAQFLEAASVSELPLDVLENHSSTMPDLQKKILSSMSLELQRDHQLLFLLGRMNAEEKLAAFLLNFSSRMKQHLWKASEFNLSMARYDIANYLGLAVETTSRLFTQFRDRGLIDINKRHIKIVDMDSLKKIVDTSSGNSEENNAHTCCTDAA